MTSLRFVFSLVGGVVCLSTQYAVVEALKVVNPNNPDDIDFRYGYAVSGIVLGVVFVIPYVLLVWAVQETYLGDDHMLPPELRGVAGFFRGLLIIAKNRAYLVCVTMFVLAWSVTNVVQSNLILYAAPPSHTALASRTCPVVSFAICLTTSPNRASSSPFSSSPLPARSSSGSGSSAASASATRTLPAWSYGCASTPPHPCSPSDVALSVLCICA